MVDERKYAFLKAVLGEAGAASLKKAADRFGELEGAIVPRAIMAWLGVVARGDYEGSIPGVEDSYLDFTKNEDGTYSGSVAIGDGIFPFQNANVFHLAASVAVSLGASLETENLKEVDMVKLGKTIDVLVKAQYLCGTEILSKALPGPPHAPEIRGAPTPPAAPAKQVDKGPKPPASAMPKKAPKEAPIPKHKVPKQKVTLPKVAKKVAVPAKATKHECKECGLPLIKNEKFVGCLCFKDVARYVTLLKNSGGYELSFAKALDDDAIAAVLQTLGVNHG